MQKCRYELFKTFLIQKMLLLFYSSAEKIRFCSMERIIILNAGTFLIWTITEPINHVIISNAAQPTKWV